MSPEAVSITPDSFKVEGDGSQVSLDIKKEPEEKSEGTVDIEVEGEGSQPQPSGERNLEKENIELKQQLYDLGNEVRNLKATMQTKAVEDIPAVAPKQGESGLSQEQLVGLIKEHGDNPEVMARIITHIATEQAQNIATGIRDETMKNVEFQSWHRELRSQNDAVMEPIFKSNPQLRDSVSDVTKRLVLDQHPMGALLVYTLMDYANRQKAEADSTASAERVEKLTKEKGLEKTRTTGEKVKGKVSLTAEQKQVADKLGLAYETYANFLPAEGA